MTENYWINGIHVLLDFNESTDERSTKNECYKMAVVRSFEFSLLLVWTSSRTNSRSAGNTRPFDVSVMKGNFIWYEYQIDLTRYTRYTIDVALPASNNYLYQVKCLRCLAITNTKWNNGKTWESTNKLAPVYTHTTAVFTRGQYWPSGIVLTCVRPSVTKFVCAITHYLFKLGSPNLDIDVKDLG